MLQSIYQETHQLDQSVKVLWIPSHIGIQGNEIIDSLANKGANKHTIEKDIGLETTKMYTAVDQYCRDKWQQEWWQRPNTQHKQLVPNLVTSGPRQSKIANTRREVTINRLKFGRCHLNAYLQQIGRHPSGKCKICGVSETVQHHLMECNNEVTKHVTAMCQARGVSLTLAMVLSDYTILKKVCELTDRDL